MFNESQKKDFLQYLKNEQKVSNNTLKRTEGYFNQTTEEETRLNKDLSLFSEAEYLSVLNKISRGGAVRTINIKNIAFKRYMRWLIKNKLPCNIKLHDIKPSQFNLLPSFQTFYFRDPNHLVEITNQMFPAITENKMGNMYRAAIYLLYIGLDTGEIMKLMKDDFDFNESKITVGNKEFHIFPEFLRDLMYVWHQKYVRIETPMHWEYTFSDNRFIRGRGDAIQWVSVRKGITRANYECRKNDPDFPILFERTIYLSGILYRMYLQEKSGQKIDMSSFIKQAYSDAEYYETEKGQIEMQFHLKVLYKNWLKANGLEKRYGNI